QLPPFVTTRAERHLVLAGATAAAHTDNEELGGCSIDIDIRSKPSEHEAGLKGFNHQWSSNLLWRRRLRHELAAWLTPFAAAHSILGTHSHLVRRRWCQTFNRFAC